MFLPCDMLKVVRRQEYHQLQKYGQILIRLHDFLDTLRYTLFQVLTIRECLICLMQEKHIPQYRPFSPVLLFFRYFGFLRVGLCPALPNKFHLDIVLPDFKSLKP